MGDVFFHLIPHAFMGGASEDPAAAAAGLTGPQGVRVVLVEEKRNVIIGVSPAREWQKMPRQSDLCFP